MNHTDYASKDASYFGRARTDVAPLLPKQLERVIEFGCATGATLDWLKRERGAGHTVGVEIEPGVAEQARARVDRVLNLDAENDPLPADLGTFDLVLCLDVLEHLRDPWRFVEAVVAARLRPGGTLIASIPNVRHAKVVLPLVFRGQWQYTSEGLLDRTHLRFFTRGSALQLLSVGGLRVTGVVDEPPAATRTWWFNRLTFGLFAPFLTVQYLIAASPASPSGGHR